TEQMAALTTPVPATPENLAHGKDLYATQCAPCHSATGTGDGSVVHLLKTKPPDLAAHGKALPDGAIYAAIRGGTGAMPALADAMSPVERWQVVLFVRSLQQNASSTAPARDSAR